MTDHKNPLTLAFDTSAAHCAVALLKGHEVLSSHTETMSRGQAERLMPMIEEILADQNIGWRDLDLIGVGTGPGNFTGIRLSVSAARGLALSLKIPAIGVSVFEAFAQSLPRPVLVALDARRDQVYLQLFGDTALAPVVASPSALPGWVHAAQYSIGDGAELLSPFLPNMKCVQPARPLAENIAQVAQAKALTPQPRPAPLYLRSADAKPSSDPVPELIV